MMGIRGRIIFTFAGLLLLGLLITLYFRQPVPEDTEYIFDSATGPAIEQITESKEQIAAIKTHQQKKKDTDNQEIPVERPQEEASVIKGLFSQIIVGSGTTLHYFTWLGHEFRQAASPEEHLEQVRDRIFSQFPPEEAAQLFSTYEQYLDCEIAVADLTAEFGPITSTEKGLDLLREVQEFRRDFLGSELADKLFGEQVKEKEYSVRRAAIINDDDLYATEKRELLDRLTQDMWGESADPETAFQQTDAYTRYREALTMHQKDLDEITTEAERRAYIDDIRNQNLSEAAIERITAMERQQAEEQRQEQAYLAGKQQIMDDTALSEEAKAAQIEHLRQEMLGDQAEAMKRRETIETAREKRFKQAGLMPDTSQ